MGMMAPSQWHNQAQQLKSHILDMVLSMAKSHSETLGRLLDPEDNKSSTVSGSYQHNALYILTTQ